MATTLRPIGHDDRLTLVDHLDELRSRLIVCVIAFAVAFGFTLWQRGPLLNILNQPLDKSTQHLIASGHGPLAIEAKSAKATKQAIAGLSGAVGVIAQSNAVSPALKSRLNADLHTVRSALPQISTRPPGSAPITIGVAEPFTATVTVAAYFALLLSLPVILYQLYAFILPAFNPTERRVALPIMAMIPLLFIAGVVFSYFVILPPAIEFMQGFNASSFQVFVQAKQLYKFEATTLLGIGLLFQLPVGILAATRVGIVTPEQLRKGRRYAIVILAVIAMLLPGTAPIPMLMILLPLLVLYEVSILLSVWVDRTQQKAAAVAGSDVDSIDEGD